MSRTFLVAVNLAGSEDLTMVAAEIEDSLLTDGIPVTSVKPWASAITEPTDGFNEFTPFNLPKTPPNPMDQMVNLTLS